MSGAQHMQIGEVAERTGLSLRTIRYYGEVGLVEPSARSRGGFRLYTETDVDRLNLIKRMKPLEFSLEETRELLEAVDRLGSAETGPDERRALSERLLPRFGLLDLDRQFGAWRQLAENRALGPTQDEGPDQRPQGLAVTATSTLDRCQRVAWRKQRQGNPYSPLLIRRRGRSPGVQGRAFG